MTRSRERSREAAQRIRHWIAEGVAAGHLQPGQRLPTDREWELRLDIARSALRKVMGELQAEGLVTRSVGRGTLLSAPRAAAPAAPADAISPSDVMQARLLLEVPMIDLVIRQATARDFEAMEQHLSASEQARSVAEFEAQDEAFHRALAQATRNPMIGQMIDLIGQARRSPLWGQLKQRSLTPERRARYQREHRELLNALRRRDAERARVLIQQHLLRIQDHLLAPG